MYLTLIAQNQFANDQISTLGNFYVGTYLKYQNLKLIFVPINIMLALFDITCAKSISK